MANGSNGSSTWKTVTFSLVIAAFAFFGGALTAVLTNQGVTREEVEEIVRERGPWVADRDEVLRRLGEVEEVQEEIRHDKALHDVSDAAAFTDLNARVTRLEEIVDIENAAGPPGR